MDEETKDLLSILAGCLMGLRVEVRAMRLEAQEARGPLSDAEADELAAAVAEADEISALFNELPGFLTGKQAQA